MKSLQQLAADAMSVQDACNGLAVANGYARAMNDLRDALVREGLSSDTDAIRRHPINRLWASKIHDLCGMGLSDMERYSEAYAACMELVKCQYCGQRCTDENGCDAYISDGESAY